MASRPIMIGAFDAPPSDLEAMMSSLLMSQFAMYERNKRQPSKEIAINIHPTTFIVRIVCGLVFSV